MAGLFGLFGGKKDQGPQSKEAFFLSEDEAKTFGDIDYMRKEVVIRRTFAKKKGLGELESVKSVSSSTAKPVGEGAKPATTSFGTSSFSTSAPLASADTSTPESTAPATPKKSASRTSDTSMDMFRNMAKNIRR